MDHWSTTHKEMRLPKARSGLRARLLRSDWRELLPAVLAPVCVTILKVVLERVFGFAPPFLLYFMAITWVAWRVGLSAGLVATVLSGIFASFFFVIPNPEGVLTHTPTLVRLVLFCIEGVFIAVLAGRARTARSAASQAAQEAQLSLAKLEGLLSGIREAVIAADSRGRITFMNANAEELLAWPFDDARGRPLSEVLVLSEDASAQPLGVALAEVALTGRAPARDRGVDLIPRVGPARAVELTATPIRPGHATLAGVVLVVRDVHARRLEQLRRAFLSEATAALVGAIRYENGLAEVVRLSVPQLAEIGIVELAETDGPGRLAVAHVDPARAEALRGLGAGLLASLEREGGGSSAQLLVRTDSATREGRASRALLDALGAHSAVVAPLKARGQRVGHVVMAMVDARRVQDDADVALAEALAERVGSAVENGRLFAEAEHARVQAERANRAKDEFLAMLGHELRNPLAPIRTALQLMKLKHPDTFVAERAIVERQFRHVVTLVDDLLDIARVTQGKVDLQREPVALADVTARALELASPLLEQHQHDVRVDVAEDIFVDADAVRLSQVFSNLLTNAAKYTPPRGHIRLNAERRADTVVVRVHDDGVGIEHHMLDQIFDSFRQGAQGIDRPRGGLGLGLAIVRSVVALHGGTVLARSDGPGKGSEFEVVLPTCAARSGTVRNATLRVAEPPRSTAARLLLVDDNVDALTLLSESLRRFGYEVVEAEDPAQALEFAVHGRVDLAVLDIGLPIMDGYELARRLHGLPGWEDVVLVSLSGYGQAADKARALAAGFAMHMVKPVATEHLHEVLQRFLAAQPEQRAQRSAADA